MGRKGEFQEKPKRGPGRKAKKQQPPIFSAHLQAKDSAATSSRRSKKRAKKRQQLLESNGKQLKRKLSTSIGSSVGLALLLIFSLHIIFNFTCDKVLWQTRTEWNEVVSDGFFTTGMTTQQTAPSENWHLERDFKLLRTFGLVRWGLGGSGHVEGTGEKLSFASQAAR
ncbi:hypothetical protein TNCT_619701 [Trichonephila clavata]|uniref:Uncharacterized protein n=1 Tax=Trichonephila clavata TaxID=2740835 RepID=A0A8X6JEA6_TRICU|nr:hypothetical protein TNCT_619701 [Trichonephila clavata]